MSATIDVDGFRAGLARDGYEAFERSLPAGPKGATHTHPFDARLLILEGAFTITVDGRATTYRPGETFSMAAGCEHAEEPGPEGVRYVAGRRQKA